MIKMLRLAAKLAGESRDTKTYYLGCVALRKDGALVKSVNHYHSGQQVPMHHAESRVLRKAGHGSVLFVARVLKCDRTTWANARPCTTCRNLIKSRGVVRVYYTIRPNEYGIWFVNKNLEQAEAR